MLLFEKRGIRPFRIINYLKTKKMNSLLKKVKRTWNQAFTSKIKLVENYLNTKYVFRYNIISCQTEILEKTDKIKIFQHVDKRKLNTLVCELNTNNIDLSVNSLKELIESDFSMVINPIHEYFKELPGHNGNDYIKELSNTVSVVNSEKWTEYLTKWLVAVIANAMTDIGCQNHTCLVLTGPQGKFKTTWLDNLCPKKLLEYSYTGKINPHNLDSKTKISEYLFINIDDQLRQLNKKDENELKNLISIPSVKYRRPYDPYITEYPRLASFMASVNGNDFLTDITGSRKFLPFEISNIDITKAKSIDMDKVWSQAYSLFKSGFIYYFNDEDIQQLHEGNKAFQITPGEDQIQLIKSLFKVPSQRSEATNFLTNAMILEQVEKITNIKLSSKKIGETLSRLGFEKWQKTDQKGTSWVYSVIQEEAK